LASGIHVIHHGIDLRKFSAGQAQPQPGLLLSVGSLNPGKGFIHMIEAAAQLRDDGHRLHYSIAGKGTEEARLRQAIADYDLEGVVEMWGEVDHDKVIDLLRQASVFVLPCVVPANGAVDGIPNALVEALAMGVPVVSTRVSGIPELITDGATGLLVEPGDVQGLASAVARLLQDDSLRAQMVRAGLQRVQRDFDVENNFLSTFALFESLLQPSEPRNDRNG
jgi:glycosyltransferase involved in cell wall biosynthesis